MFIMRRTAPTRTETLAWFTAGLLFSIALVIIQIGAVGDVTGLLTVGEASPLRPFIEDRIGPVAAGTGHDAQVTIAIAHDLDGDVIGDLIPDAGYRYRRILFPLLATAGGLLEGRVVVWSLVALAVLAVASSVAMLPRLASQFGAPRWTVAGILLNPGVWLSLWVLTPDAVGLALALGGILLVRARAIGFGATLLTLATLTKEQFILVPAGLALWFLLRREPRRAITVAAPPLITLLAWLVLVETRVGDAFTSRGNFGLPLQGIWESVSELWGSVPASDVAIGALMIGLTVAASVLVVRVRGTMLFWLTLPWIGVAIVASDWVWEYGNNAARVFAILGVLTVLCAGAATGKADVEGDEGPAFVGTRPEPSI